MTNGITMEGVIKIEGKVEEGKGKKKQEVWGHRAVIKAFWK